PQRRDIARARCGDRGGHASARARGQNPGPAMTRALDAVIGAVIAGGASSRFGSPKALATVGGTRVVDRVIRSLRTALGHRDVIAIVNDADLASRIGLPHRADVRAGAGALGGVHAALVWARERGSDGVLAAGCDMPF